MLDGEVVGTLAPRPVIVLRPVVHVLQVVLVVVRHEHTRTAAQPPEGHAGTTAA